MYTHPLRDDMAHGRVVRTDAVVRLRRSSMERLLLVLRWMFTVAGAVVVLWVGAAFLASPASAAVAMPATMIAQQGAQKVGSSKSSGADKKKPGKKKADKKSGKKSEKKSEKKEKQGKNFVAILPRSGGSCGGR